MLNDNDIQLVKAAIAPNTGSAALTGIKVDATGYSRARFIFTFGGTAGVGSFVSAGVWAASTSGAVFSSNATQVLLGVSSGILSANAQIMILDAPVSSATPWLLISGALNSASSLYNSCVVELYRGVTRPPTHTEQQIVVV